MCRLLITRADAPFSISERLGPFAEMCRASKEYQGHGWGMAWLNAETGQWCFHHEITPIWEDELGGFGRTRLLVVHARSAFRNEGIVVENNMPFYDGRRVFIFNGELRGVRIRSEGRIGAEKIFNFIRRFDRGDLQAALAKGSRIIRYRSDYVRAFNLVMVEGDRIHLASHFSEDPEYFTMYRRDRGNEISFCSQPLGDHWSPLANGTELVA